MGPALPRTVHRLEQAIGKIGFGTAGAGHEFLRIVYPWMSGRPLPPWHHDGRSPACFPSSSALGLKLPGPGRHPTSDCAERRKTSRVPVPRVRAFWTVRTNWMSGDAPRTRFRIPGASRRGRRLCLVILCYRTCRLRCLCRPSRPLRVALRASAAASNSARLVGSDDHAVRSPGEPPRDLSSVSARGFGEARHSQPVWRTRVWSSRSRRIESCGSLTLTHADDRHGSVRCVGPSTRRPS